MIVLDKGLAFACTPVCGKFVLEAIRIGELEILCEVGSIHKPFAGDYKKLLRVSCIMHPCDWIREVWNKGILTRSFADFNFYVNYVILNHAGFVTRTFDTYQADTVLRVEDFPWCLIELLKTAGYDEGTLVKIREVKGYNSTGRDLPPWNEHLLREFKESERGVCERYDYF